jgi:uncharacterized membrane protein YgcG
VLALSAMTAPARANGRFPNAQQGREFAPGSLALTGTYGLLLTTNAGTDFQFVCESELFGIAADTITADPLLELGPGGSILTGSLEGARISRDHGCTFEPLVSLPRDWEFYETEPPPGAENGLVLDFSRRGAESDAPVIALVALFNESGAIIEHRVYEAPSGDDFRPIGAPIALSAMDFGSTLDAAPSDPNRVYVSGTLRGEPVVLASRDGAESFMPSALAPDDPDAVVGAYIAAVSPSDPERLYVRVPRRMFQKDNGLYTWDDSLLVSDDGGANFSERLRVRANILGFALSPDGETVLAGFGDPSASRMLSDPAAVGVYRADAGELVFTKIVNDLDVTCLFWTEGALYACAAERDPLGNDPALANDFHLGVYRGRDVPTTAGDFVPLLKLRDVRGPLPWLDGRRTQCADTWQTSKENAPTPTGACAVLNACGPRPALSAGALICGSSGGAGAGGADSGGADSGGADSGGADSGGAPGHGGSDAAGAPDPGRGGAERGGAAGTPQGETRGSRDGGCGCRLDDRRSEGSLMGLIALVLSALLTIRRRGPAGGLGTGRTFLIRFLLARPRSFMPGEAKAAGRSRL